MTPKNSRIVWSGGVSNCDLCEGPIDGTFYDGKTSYGPWAVMCPACFEAKGSGLGTGRGQEYKWNRRERKWIKTRG